MSHYAALSNRLHSTRRKDCLIFVQMRLDWLSKARRIAKVVAKLPKMLCFSDIFLLLTILERE